MCVCICAVVRACTCLVLIACISVHVCASVCMRMCVRAHGFFCCFCVVVCYVVDASPLCCYQYYAVWCVYCYVLVLMMSSIGVLVFMAACIVVVDVNGVVALQGC